VQPDDIGSTITVIVMRTGNSGSVTSLPTAVVIDLPALTGTVSISGNPWVGQTLTVNTSDLGGSGDISYQWNRNGVPIPGATSGTYVVQAGDVGSAITVTVTRDGYSGYVTSSNLVNAREPNITNSITRFYITYPVLTPVLGTIAGSTITVVVPSGTVTTNMTVRIEHNGAYVRMGNPTPATPPNGGYGDFYAIFTGFATVIPQFFRVRSESGVVSPNYTVAVTVADPDPPPTGPSSCGNFYFDDTGALVTAPDMWEHTFIPSEIDGHPVTAIGYRAFFSGRWYANSTDVTIPGSVISIGIEAFAQNGLETVIFNTSLVYIGARAFYGNNLTALHLPVSVAEIGADAFYHSEITTIIIPGGVTIANAGSMGGSGAAFLALYNYLNLPAGILRTFVFYNNAWTLVP